MFDTRAQVNASPRGNRVVLALFALLWLWTCTCMHAQQAYADGGAPNLAYISGTPSGISVIDIAQRRVIRTIHVDGNPTKILLSLDGTLLFIARPDREQVSIIDTATERLVCSATLPYAPTQLVLAPDMATLYAAGGNGTEISSIDPASCTIRGRVSVGSPITGLAVSLVASAFPGSSGDYQLWASTTNAVLVFDTNARLLATFPCPQGPRYLSIPPGDFTYVATDQGSIEAIDIFAHTMLSPLITGGVYGAMDYNEYTGEVYVPDLRHDLVAVIAPPDPNNNGARAHEPVRTIAVSSPPTAIAITGDGQLGLIAQQNGTVSLLDLISHHSIATVSVGGHPHFIITGVYPPTPASSRSSSATPSLSHPPAWFLLPTVGASLVLISLLAVCVLLIYRQRRRSR
jgi:DNA-binding beta-propeller fold protein YncE